MKYLQRQVSWVKIKILKQMKQRITNSNKTIQVNLGNKAQFTKKEIY